MSAPERPHWTRQIVARLLYLVPLKAFGTMALMALFFWGYFGVLRFPLAPATVMPQIVVLRGWYRGRKRWPARLIEGVIFGMVATVLHPVARYVFESRLGFPGDVANNAAITFVCALGYIGADTLSDAAKTYFWRE